MFGQSLADVTQVSFSLRSRAEAYLLLDQPGDSAPCSMSLLAEEPNRSWPRAELKPGRKHKRARNRSVAWTTLQWPWVGSSSEISLVCFWLYA